MQALLKPALEESEDAGASDGHKPAINVDFVVVHEANSAKDGYLVR